MKALRALLLILMCLFLISCSSQSQGSSEGKPSPQESQTYIQNTGSDTIVNLALAWAEKYQQNHPEIRISVSGGGSGTGIASLINGTVDIANASRAIKGEEIETARTNGIDPQEFIISRDAIAVIVNPSNPVSELTLRQISDIYSGKINNWAEVGGEDRPIVRLSRETNSGTHIYFLEHVLRLGNSKDKTLFAQNTLLLPSSEGIIAEVSDNPNAIGYDGLGYITPEVKVIAVAKETDQTPIIPSIETVNNGTYPIARDLYMYTASIPQGAVKNYIDWILGPEAQQIVSDLGFVPIHSP